MKRITLSVVTGALGVGLLLAPGCRNEPEAEPGGQPEARPAAPSAAPAQPTQRAQPETGAEEDRAWTERLETELDAFDEELEALEARARNLGAEGRSRLEQQIAELKVEQRRLREALDRVGEEGGTQARQELQQGWSALEKRLESLRDGLQTGP